MFPGNYWFKWILGVTFRFKTAVSGLSLIYPGDLAESRSRTTRAEQLRQISIFTSTIMVSVVQRTVLFCFSFINGLTLLLFPILIVHCS